jgi:alkaline phosphatase D
MTTVTSWRTIGDLLNLNVLDTRLFRLDQPCGDGVKADCREALEPHRTMLGDTQERWLYDGFKHTRARWTVLGQQVMVMHCDRDPDPHVVATSMDKWDGAVAARDRLFAAVEDASPMPALSSLAQPVCPWSFPHCHPVLKSPLRAADKL